MYSVHVTSDHNRQSSNRRIPNRTTDYQRQRHRRPSIRISNANQLIRYIRDNLFKLCSTQSTVTEHEYIDLDSTTTGTKPERIDVLCQMSKFSRRELKIMYREFKNECPDGILREDNFKKNIYQNFFPRGADTSNYAHFVFNSFDTENRGEITFTDFILGLSVLMRGSTQEKINWTFRLYDTKRKGFLDKNDFKRILNAIYEMMNSMNSKNSKSGLNPIDEQTHLDLVFQKFDINQTGRIKLSDFVKTCTEDEQIMRSLNVLNTVI